MADFKTHLRVGTVAAVAGAVGCASFGLVSPAWVPILSLAGVVGAIAPDIDSDSGRPLRIIFPSLAALLPPVLIWRVPELHRALPETLGAWLVLSWLLYSPARWLVCRLSRHRGSFHSLPAALCFGL
ncbi:MAG: hypothetical protein VYD19_11070, partial [Myxococcota bacterium]|nr:hypothetical protein [Myxococcota bacterium]